MTHGRESLTLQEARRIALAAQGFDRPRPATRIDIRHLRRTIRQLGLLQIDYVNVLVPAQYQVPYSRLGPYDISLLDSLVYRRREFTEQWAREASIVPMESWPLLRHRREGHDRTYQHIRAFMEGHPEYAGEVVRLVREGGPVTRSDVPEPNGAPRERKGTFWAWSKGKMALEGHFASGTFAIADRRAGFTRVYDLADRVVPKVHFERRVERDAAQRELLLAAARAHGISTVHDLADYYRIPIQEARLRVGELVSAGELLAVRVQGWVDAAYLHPDARLPRAIHVSTLLSPFDPVVWYRRRAARLFDFDYLLEIWVPEAKRRWGYYVLPFLLGDRIVGRVDLKADRERRRLLVQATYFEAHAALPAAAEALAAELQTMATWLGLESVAVERRGNGARPLAAVLRG